MTLTSKPISQWNTEEVAAWLCSLGGEDVVTLAAAFRKRGVRGKELARMDHAKLENVFGVTDEFVRDKILDDLTELKQPQQQPKVCLCVYEYGGVELKRKKGTMK